MLVRGAAGASRHRQKGKDSTLVGKALLRPTGFNLPFVAFGSIDTGCDLYLLPLILEEQRDTGHAGTHTCANKFTLRKSAKWEGSGV
jgi:hypothetical protein